MRAALVAFLVGCSGGDRDHGPPPGDGDEPGSEPIVTTGTPYDHLPVRATFLWDQAEVNGQPIVYHVSTDTPPKGLMFVFHGSYGNIGTVMQLEWLELYDLIVPRGIALVLTQSLDRTDEQWDTSDRSPDNGDFQTEVAVRQWLIDNTLVDEDTPIEAMGFSNGGSFVDLFAGLASGAGWDMRTYLVHNSAGYSSGLPAFFVSAEHDERVGAEGVEQSAEACRDQTGGQCEYRAGVEIPLDPRRFARMPEYSLEASQAVFDDLVDMGFVDADGHRLVQDLSDPDGVMDYYANHTKVRQPSPTLPPTELRVVWATHRVSAQFAVDEANWLLDHL